jgi:Glu-tRNA(Gln) amidotransferase subunit E-like FAD-binding protein
MDALNNKKILMAANKIALAIEAELEEILEHAEVVVKDFVPARHVKATLVSIEKALENEGIEVLFDKTVSREALRKTASEEVSSDEIKEVVEELVKAIVDEIEDVLNDTDDVTDETVTSLGEDDGFEIESKLKGILEKKLAVKGVYFRLDRKNAKK